MDQRAVLSVILILLITVTRWELVSSLQCYQCSTKNHTDCPSSSFLIECDEKAAKAHHSPLETHKTLKKKNETDDYDMTSTAHLPEPANLASSIKQEERIPACFKKRTHITAWFNYEVGDTEWKKRFKKPRYTYSCGLAPKGKANMCTNRNTREFQNSDCTCTDKDGCNGSGRLLIASFHYYCPNVIIIMLMVTVLLPRSTFFA